MTKPPEPRPPSLRTRLFFGLLAPLSLLFLIGGVVSYALAQHFADRVYDGWLFDSVSSLALEVQRRGDGAFVDLPPSTQRLFEWDVSDATYFRVTGSRRGLLIGRPDLPDPPESADPYGEARLFDARLDGQPVRVAVLELPAETYGETVRVEVAETTRKRRGLAHTLLFSALVPQLLLIAVAAATVRRGVRSGLLPLRQIAQRLETRGPRHLSPLGETSVPDEVRPLTRALDELLAKLERADTAQRRFIADAAHQLRTPLTAIKLQAQQIRRESRETELQPLLLTLSESTDRAVRLSNQLLTLARAEPGNDRALHFMRVDLSRVVREAGAEWIPAALARGMDMQFSAVGGDEAPVWIDGDVELLREAIGNLLDNAIQYGPAGGRIDLRVAALPQPTIVIEDQGPGIAEAQRVAMLGRFVRGGGGQGSGLGLSIAHEIARLHGGDLVLDAGFEGRGLRVRLSVCATIAPTGSVRRDP